MPFLFVAWEAISFLGGGERRRVDFGNGVGGGRNWVKGKEGKLKLECNI